MNDSPHMRKVARLQQRINAPAQMAKSTVADTGKTKHTLWGPAKVNLEDGAISEHPVLIEVMEYNLGSAKSKVNKIGDTKKGQGVDFRSIMIAYNGKAKSSDYDAESGKIKTTASLANYAGISGGATELQDELESNDLNGGAFPIVWSPTDPSSDNTYSLFPFLEMRARVPAHAGSNTVAEHTKDKAGDKAVIGRSMDSDVSDDPLLENTLSTKAKSVLFTPLVSYVKSVSSGGYNWKTQHDNPNIWNTVNITEKNEYNFRLRQCIDAINLSEHIVRLQINQISSKAIYWPEPNTYMLYSLRKTGANALISESKKPKFKDSQQREAVAFLLNIMQKGTYLPRATTTKPLKGYFDNNLIPIIKKSRAEKISYSEILIKIIDDIRQSHLRLEKSEDTYKWHTKQLMPTDMKGAIKKVVDAERSVLGSQLSRILNIDYTMVTNTKADTLLLPLFNMIHQVQFSLKGNAFTSLETLQDILEDHYPMKDPGILAMRLDNWMNKNITNPKYKNIRPLLLELREAVG